MKKLGKFVDMANEPEADEPSPIPAIETARKYPWNLCISLTEKELAKLGVEGDGDVDVGDIIHLFALAKVTAMSSRDGEAGSNRSIELQITHLSIEDEDEENEMSDDERAEKRYKSTDG